VINVSYLDSLEYVAWLNGRVGADVYRLPTEAEWEYAARAGTQTRFAQGDELTADQANFSRRATEHLRQLPTPVQLPHLTNREKPVSVHELNAANAWGLRHMSGNVLELTLSCWTEEHLGLASDSAYLRLAQSQSHCRRVAKGGAFNFAMDGVRPARRTPPLETYRRDHLGFRIIREMTKE
jgi:formylglycine-generating enzyme required for sulfatase activity